MPTQYYMRAYNTTLLTYVDWIVNDVPDSTGTFSGYPTNQLANITVNRIVQSKILNFLKPNEALGGSDGYYFHLNSYDWRNVTTPLNTPPQVTGLAVERGATSGTAVTAASNATPIQITSAGHGLVTGQLATITGVLGNLAANGTFNVTRIDANNFTLNGTVGGGAYTSGGTVYTPRDFSTLTWDETNSLWRFVLNTKGDGTTLGNHQQLRINNLFNDGYISSANYIALGNNPAQSGIIRIPNDQWIEARRASGTTDGYLIKLDSTDRVQIGTLADNPVTYIPGNLRVDGYVRDGGTPSLALGFVRVSNNTTALAVRGATNVNDHSLLATNNTATDTNTGSALNNNLIVANADATFGNIVFNAPTARAYQFQINSVPLVEIGTTGNTATNDANNFIRFNAGAGITNPTIYQFHTTSGSGQTLNIQAQSTTAAATGGVISLTSGSGLTGGFGGTVDFLTGNAGAFPVAATLKMRIFPTVAPTAANNNSIQIFENLIRIDSAQTAPRYRQDDVNITSTPGQPFTVQAQNAIGATSAGGDLNLSSGTGTTVAGFVNIQTGGITRVQVSPTQTTIFGNLLVGGTTTSIASTVVELADRVLNLNSSANSFPANAPIPTDMAGIAVDRGTTGGVKRNYHGLFWDEPDGYWKFAVSTDGYTTQTDTALTSTLPVMFSYAIAQPTATRPVTVNVIPTVGGFRVLNNTTAVASRTAAATQDLLLLGTDSTNHITMGASASPQDAGFIFYTSTGSIYDFQVNNVTQVQLGAADIDGSGFSETIALGSTVSNPRMYQTTRAGTGANNGFHLKVNAQAGQQQTGATVNNNGGIIFLASGSAGTGGTVSTGFDGYVEIQTGLTPKIRVYPTFSTTASDNNSILFFENKFRIDTAQTTPLIRQDNTAGASGTSLTLQAQNAATTGGPLLLQSGTGATNDGYINLITGATTKMTVFPTIAVSAADNNSILFFENLFRIDTAQTTPLIRQDDKTSNGGTGESFTIQAQNETGTTSTGGNLVLKSGTGTTASGEVRFNTGATLAGYFNANRVLRIGQNPSTDISVFATTFPLNNQILYGHNTTGNALSTLSTADAAAVAELILFNTSNASQHLALYTGGSTYSNAAFRGNGAIEFGGDATSSLVFATTNAAGTGGFANLHRMYQSGALAIGDTATNNTSTLAQAGLTGPLVNIGVITGGTLTSAANQMLSYNNAGVHTSQGHAGFRAIINTTTRLDLTGVLATWSVPTVTFDNAQVTPRIKQDDKTTNSGTGETFTIQAQNETGTTSNGGDLNLTSGTGTSLDGYLNLQAGGSTVVKVHTNKVSFLKGWRRHVTNVTTTYQILVTDDYLAVTALAAPYTVTLPASPIAGDTYTIKDTTGNAGTNTLTIAGNGNNIDGSASYVINQAYAAATFTFAGGQWSVS